MKGRSSTSCKNLNETSNSGNSSGDESSQDTTSFARTSETTHRSSSHVPSYQPQLPTSSGSAMVSASQFPSLYHHPGFKFDPGMSSLSHCTNQPFGEMSSSSLVMQKNSEAAAMLHLSAASGVDYSGMSAIASLAPPVPPNH